MTRQVALAAAILILWAALPAPVPATAAGPEPAVERHISAVSGFSFGSKVLAARTPVLVDFSASWCLPCQAIEKSLGTVAAAWGDRVRIVRVNVTWSPALARRYQVTALPTLLLFDHGVVVDRSTGASSVRDIQEMLTGSLETQVAAALPSPEATLAAAVPAAVENR